MKVLSRDFTLKEKLLILLLGLVLVGLAYYQIVDQPVRTAVATAQTEAESLRTELSTVEAKLERMRRMRAELEDVTAGGTASEMGSYNNSKAEIASLNDILSEALQYSISFANVTRSGDQIRRTERLPCTLAQVAQIAYGRGDNVELGHGKTPLWCQVMVCAAICRTARCAFQSA